MYAMATEDAKQNISEAHTLLGAIAERDADLVEARRAYGAARKADPDIVA